MGFTGLSRGDAIFANQNVLRSTHTPQKLEGVVEREKQLSDFGDALQPIINSDEPNNIFVYGKEGTGKTMISKMFREYILSEQEGYDDLDVRFITVDVDRDSSSYQVATKIVNEFRVVGNKIAKTGHSTAGIIDMIFEEIRELDKTHVVFTLDEFDGLGNDSRLLKKLTRANNRDDLSGTYVSVIGVSNNLTYKETLDGDVIDSLGEREVHFTSYDANQLSTILKQRKEKAFQPGVVDDGVVPLCAALTSSDSGSARRALDLLMHAGENARKEYKQDPNAEPRVTENHVHQAKETAQGERIKKELESLPSQMQNVVNALTLLQRDGQSPSRTQEIYNLYKAICRSEGEDPKTKRTVQIKLNELVNKGFITISDTKNHGIDGGAFRLYELGNVDEEIFVEYFSTTDVEQEASTKQQKLT